MKKIISILICIGGFFVAKAQFGVQLGVDFYANKVSSDNVSINYDLKPGISAGILYNFSLGDNFSFMPSLNFTQKGGKLNKGDLTDTLDGNNYSYKLTLDYIELPLNFIYYTKGFFIGTGPVIGYGFSGKEKITDKQFLIHSKQFKKLCNEK